MRLKSETVREWLPNLVIIAVVWSAWLIAMTFMDLWGLFADNWFMSVTMAFGSFIAGATSEGGGAVAFPAMTLIFGIEPQVARDFSFMIQSVGMTAASLLIVWMRISVEWRAIIFAGLGGIFGVIIGIEFITQLLTPAYTKIFFVSFWLSFGVALYWINKNREREILTRINNFSKHEAFLLFMVGIVGGMVSGVTGSGLDIVTFSFLVLAFNLCEKVATPTSVVLMASNAVFGFLWRGGVEGTIAVEAWNFWWVCVPVVVVGAPLGARFIRNKTRHFIAGMLYTSILLQYFGALYVIPQSAGIVAFNMLIFLVGLVFFRSLTRIGQRRAGEAIV